MKLVPPEFHYDLEIHWQRDGFSHYFVQCLLILSQTTNHKYYKQREGIFRPPSATNT